MSWVPLCLHCKDTSSYKWWRNNRTNSLWLTPTKSIPNGRRCCVTAINPPFWNRAKLTRTLDACILAVGAAHAPTSNGWTLPGAQDPSLHHREIESTAATSSIPRLWTTPCGFPTKEETERSAISTSPVQEEWKVVREHTPTAIGLLNGLSHGLAPIWWMLFNH